MVDGINGNLGILGNVESVTCRFNAPVYGLNPTLTARIESAIYGQAPNSAGNTGQ
jgi:hypothetical protein